MLTSLRSIVHALRGWPTPYGAAVNSLETRFETIYSCSDPKVTEQLATVGRQAAQFALAFNARDALGDLDQPNEGSTAIALTIATIATIAD